MKTAKLIKDVSNKFVGVAKLFELSEPVQYDYDWSTELPTKNTNYVIVSAIDSIIGKETYIFPSDKEGNILGWEELDGSYRGEMNIERALNNMRIPHTCRDEPLLKEAKNES